MKNSVSGESNNFSFIRFSPVSAKPQRPPPYMKNQGVTGLLFYIDILLIFAIMHKMSWSTKLKQSISPAGLAFAAAMSGAANAYAANENSQEIKHPHITLKDIDLIEAQRFLDELKKIKRRTGKNARIYVHIDSQGGLVDEGWDILNELNTSYLAGYNIRLVCKQAMSMAGVIFSGFIGNRFALEECKLITHSSYFLVPKYINFPEQPHTIFSPKGWGPLKTSQLPYGIWIDLKVDMDSPFITPEQATKITQTNNEFTTTLSYRSCKLDFPSARPYFSAQDKDIDLRSALSKNLVDDVIRLNDKGLYEIDYNYRVYKDNCRTDKQNVVPSQINRSLKFDFSFN